MHDWNVDPHIVVPVINQLKDAGIEAKGLFGQWDHIILTDPITTLIGREKAEVVRIPSDDSLRLDARSSRGSITIF